jgi:hypothetical protein
MRTGWDESRFSSGHQPMAAVRCECTASAVNGQPDLPGRSLKLPVDGHVIWVLVRTAFSARRRVTMVGCAEHVRHSFRASATRRRSSAPSDRASARLGAGRNQDDASLHSRRPRHRRSLRLVRRTTGSSIRGGARQGRWRMGSAVVRDRRAGWVGSDEWAARARTPRVSVRGCPRRRQAAEYGLARGWVRPST